MTDAVYRFMLLSFPKKLAPLNGRFLRCVHKFPFSQTNTISQRKKALLNKAKSMLEIEHRREVNTSKQAKPQNW